MLISGSTQIFRVLPKNTWHCTCSNASHMDRSICIWIQQHHSAASTASIRGTVACMRAKVRSFDCVKFRRGGRHNVWQGCSQGNPKLVEPSAALLSRSTQLNTPPSRGRSPGDPMGSRSTVTSSVADGAAANGARLQAAQPLGIQSGVSAHAPAGSRQDYYIDWAAPISI